MNYECLQKFCRLPTTALGCHAMDLNAPLSRENGRRRNNDVFFSGTENDKRKKAPNCNAVGDRDHLMHRGRNKARVAPLNAGKKWSWKPPFRREISAAR